LAVWVLVGAVPYTERLAEEEAPGAAPEGLTAGVLGAGAAEEA